GPGPARRPDRTLGSRVRSRRQAGAGSGRPHCCGECGPGVAGGARPPCPDSLTTRPIRSEPGDDPTGGGTVIGEFFRDIDWLHFLTIPVFTGVVGLLINWSGLWMLFSPVRFHGVRIPGMRELATLLPRKLQEVPGLLQGGVGWQGIIPARAAKMGRIPVPKGTA